MMLPLLLTLFLGFGTLPAHAFEWSHTEFHFQYGDLRIPSWAGGGDAEHYVYTIQHASGWQYGDHYFFIDFMDAQNVEFQDLDIWGEWYTNLSLGKYTGREFRYGLIKDVGLMMGFNWGKKSGIKKYLPGIRFALDLPGFQFINVDFMAVLDGNDGLRRGRSPAETHGYMLNVNFIRPFTIADQQFSIEGYVEYIGPRRNELDHTVKHWILTQPQFRWHVTDYLALGIEWQFWLNKFGDAATDESVVQSLIVWKF